MASMRNTSCLAVTAQGRRLGNGDVERGPLGLTVPHRHWDVIEALLGVRVEDLFTGSCAKS